MQIELIGKGRAHDKDIFFCRFKVGPDQEITVTVTAQMLKELKGDLEKVCKYAVEDALRDGSRVGLGSEVEVVGNICMAVKKRLRSEYS